MAKTINFEDLDDTNEGLVEMRGEGRYFGSIEDDVERKCKKCGKTGHLARACSLIVCDSCGEKNDHLSRNCPKSKRCSRCGQIGHLRSDCKEKAVPIYCHRCKLRTHTEETCPQIWRNYLVSKKKTAQYPSTVSCYNCGEDGHYGDDCKEAKVHQLKYVEPSSFSGKIFSGKHRTKYESALKQHKRKVEEQSSMYDDNLDSYSSRTSGNDYSGNNRRNNKSDRGDYRNDSRGNYRDDSRGSYRDDFRGGYRENSRGSYRDDSRNYRDDYRGNNGYQRDNYSSGNKRKYDSRDNYASRQRSNGYDSGSSFQRYDSYDDFRSNHSTNSNSSSKRQKFSNAGQKISKKFRDIKDSAKKVFKRK